jgi:hypothetical protein
VGERFVSRHQPPWLLGACVPGPEPVATHFKQTAKLVAWSQSYQRDLP